MQNLNIKYIKGNNIMITGDSKVCKIPWDQTVTLNILQRNTVEKQTIVDQCVILHSGIDEGMFNNLEDGYYTVYHLIIPNINWLESNKKDISEFYRYNNIYVYKEGIIINMMFEQINYQTQIQNNYWKLIVMQLILYLNVKIYLFIIDQKIVL